jgi:NAD+ kinase
MDVDTPARVAVRGAGADALREAVADAGASVVDRDPDAVVVAGEDALFALADDPPTAPVLPVADQSTPLTVTPDRVAAALSGPLARRPHPVLDIRVDGEPVGHALADATLVTSESARISEFTICSDGRRVDGFRADGVVVATPLGSAGYARAAGGPVVAPNTGLAVVPVGQFATARGAWVLTPPIDCAIDRDEVPVSLVLDGAVVAAVEVDRPVRVASADALDLIVPADGVESF